MWNRLAKLTPPPAVRRWAYTVLVPTIPLLTAYGVVDDRKGALWLAAGAAVLGFGMAAPNVNEGP